MIGTDRLLALIPARGGSRRLPNKNLKKLAGRSLLEWAIKGAQGSEYIDQIIVSTGAKQSLAQLLMAIVNPGNEIIVPAPYWVSYFQMVKMAEGTPVVIEATVDADFKVTAKQVEQAITAKTKAFLFSTPCNPTGSVYSKNELAALVKVFESIERLLFCFSQIYNPK